MRPCIRCPLELLGTCLLDRADLLTDHRWREAESRDSQAAVSGSRILILDEPTSVLTRDEADQVLGRLRELTQAGVLSVLLITHKLREVNITVVIFCRHICLISESMGHHGCER